MKNQIHKNYIEYIRKSDLFWVWFICKLEFGGAGNVEKNHCDKPKIPF